MTNSPEIATDEHVASAAANPGCTSAAVKTDPVDVPEHGKQKKKSGTEQNENEKDPENLLVDEKLVQEEERARVETEKTKSSSKPAPALTQERLAKLDVLLDKAQMYSLFLVEQVESMQDQLDQVQLKQVLQMHV